MPPEKKVKRKERKRRQRMKGLELKKQLQLENLKITKALQTEKRVGVELKRFASQSYIIV